MTNPREIMAETVYGHVNFVDGLDESFELTDACLAALTAAWFEVRRRTYVLVGDGITDDTEAMQALIDGHDVRRTVEREALRERIEQTLDPFVCSTGHLMSVYPGSVVNAILAVLETPTEEGNG